MNQASCESIYIPHTTQNTAQNTAENTAQNSDEEMDDMEGQLGAVSPTICSTPPAVFLRQESNTLTLLGSRSSNGEVHFGKPEK